MKKRKLKAKFETVKENVRLVGLAVLSLVEEVGMLDELLNAATDDIERLHEQVDMWADVLLKDRVASLEDAVFGGCCGAEDGFDKEDKKDYYEFIPNMVDRSLVNVVVGDTHLGTFNKTDLYEFHAWCNFNDLPLFVR